FTEKIGLGGGAVDSMVSGIFPDFGSTMSQPASEVNKKNYAKDPDAFKEKYAGNIVYQGFMSIDNGNMNVGGVTELTGYKLAEQIMSLTGTLIVSWDSNGENSAITPIPPTMKAADFIKGTGSGNVKLNVCNPTPDLRSNRKAQCLEMRQDSIQFKGLSETIIETLLEIQRAVRNDTELTQDQRKLISMLGVNNIIPTLQTLSAAEGVQYINDISTIAAKNFTIELLSSVQNKMTNMTLPSEAMASFKDQLEKINQTFRNQIRSASEVQSIQNTEEKTVLAYWDMAYVKKRTYGDSGNGG
ncbi:conjugal transfer protein TraH, partial [Klebsiella pneumoniae]|nr:conjugal transfer protein TraH [Klebsiella pneumoniae]EKW6028469.1 conjugal transfer protein TraH [Klebsiella pneumoniae]ELB5068784.1 conjugal transfer protein TraH [Klebsiella pneumoniae]